MVSNQNANFPVGQVPDDSLNVEDRYWIDTREWFVQQYETRIGSERPGDLDTPPLATGQAYPQAGSHMTDVQLV